MSVSVDSCYQPTDSDFTNAFNKALSSNSFITLLDHDYPIRGTIIMPVGSSVIGIDENVTSVTTSSPSGDMFTTSGMNKIKNIQCKSSVTRVSDNYINLYGINLTVSGVTFTGCYKGITAQNGTSIVKLKDLTFNMSLDGGTCITIGNGTSGGSGPLACSIDDVVMNSPNKVNANIEVLNCGDLSLSRIQSLSATYNLLVDPPSGCEVDSIKAVLCFFDHAISTNLLAQPIGTGCWQRSNFTNCWFGSGKLNNVALVASGSAFIDGISFDDCDGVFSSSGSGFVAIGNVKNSGWRGGKLSGNIDGAYLAPNAGYGHLKVIDAFVGRAGGFAGNSSTGVVLAGAGDYNEIRGNDAQGNGAWLINNNGGANNVTSPNLVS